MTGDEETAAPPPPNCGSASCNAARKGFSLRNNKKDGTRSDPGPDGAVPQTETTRVTQYINRDDLVKNDVAENGNYNAIGGGAYNRLKNGGVRFIPQK